MTEKKPLKRDKSLIPFSKDHHHGLLLSWKIRTGIRKNIDPQRISEYVYWFYQNHLLPHFQLEEKYMFPILAPNDDLIVQAIGDHRKISELVSKNPDVETLNAIADTLEKHIRFEERIIFEKIQSAASETQLAEIERIHRDQPFVEHPDEFWK